MSNENPRRGVPASGARQLGRSRFLLAACLALAGPACATTYHLADLGPDEANGEAILQINGTGVGAGYVFRLPSSYWPALFDHGNVQVLPALTGNGNAWATGINDAGVAVGWSSVNMTQHAVRWIDGEVEDLGTLVKGDFNTWSTAGGINSKGEICGSSATADPQVFHAFVVDARGRMRDVGAPDGNTAASCSAINAKGHLAILSGTHAYVFRAGAFTRLDAGPGSVSEVDAMNSSDEIVGRMTRTQSADGTAFLWSKGVLHDLGVLPGSTGQRSWARGINDAGVVVGYTAIDPAGDAVAFVRPGRVMIDLNTLVDESGAGWQLLTADGINESGQIAGGGILNGVPHHYLLTPNP